MTIQDDRLDNLLDGTAAAPLVFETSQGVQRRQTGPGTDGPSHWGRQFASRLVFTDVLALGWAAAGVHLAQVSSATSVARPTIWLTVTMVTIWFVGLTTGGTRAPTVVGHGAAEYKRIAQVTLVVFGGAAILAHVLDFALPRSYLLAMMPAGLVGLLVGRYIWRRWLQLRRDFGHFQSRVLAVGTVQTVTALVNELQRAPRAGYRVVAVCLTDPQNTKKAHRLMGLPVLGGIADVKDGVQSSDIDTVAVTASAHLDPAVVRNLSWELEDTTAGLVLAPALTDIAGPRIHTEPVNGLPLIHVQKPTYRGANQFLKKAFDVVGATVLIALFSVPLLVIAAGIKLTSPGPIFFRQSRVGLNGELFRMIKFRSMVVDAEARLAELKKSRDDDDAGNDVLFKMKDDPRVTKIGKVLRRLSLDELPQLFNVLGGSMSLVGPRPPLADEVLQYGTDARRRLLVKPGMTGLWQVSGRSNLTWEESVRLDSYYVENWSITGDLVILWKTVRAVAGGGGAF